MEVPWSRLAAFGSTEQMDKHDREIEELMSKYEEARHRSEVRTLLRIRVDVDSWVPVERYMAIVERKRGKVARDALAQAVRQQWQSGNRGQKGDWR